MSTVPQGPQWWQASDGRWYPPESHPDYVPPPPPPPPVSQAPPGWYRDATGQPIWRWWTGSQWSDDWAPMASNGQSSARDLQSSQAELDKVVGIGVWTYVIVTVLSILLIWANSTHYVALWHWWNEVRQDARLGLPAPPVPTSALSTLTTLLGLVVLAFEVTFLIWQYRAARVAAALGYRAARSPGWGVGCWFVPVVNLWMPYGALRDCLPPGHPARRQVLFAWLLWTGLLVLTPSTVVALVGAHFLGVGLVFVCVAAQVAFGLNAARAVKAIAADHQFAPGGGAPR